MRICSLLLVFLILFAGTVGCGRSKDTAGSDETGKTVGDGQEEQPKEEKQPQEEQPAEEEPTVDLGGRVIRVGATWNLEPQEGVSESGDRYIARLRNLMEKYNFSLEYAEVPWDQFAETFISSTLSGQPWVDISYAESTFFYPTFVVGGLVLPLSDMGVFDFNDPKWNKTVIEYSTYNGKVYGMNTGRDDVRSVLFWNKTMFEREGLPNLYELQNNKTWTWDKFLEVAQKATKDLDGDGVIDQYGFSGIKTEWIILATNNGKTVKFVDGKPTFGLTEPEALEALQFYQDLVNVHRVYDLPPDGSPWDYGTQRFINGKTAMLMTELWHWEMMKQSMHDEYGVVAPPMGPRANEYVSLLNVFNAVCIPATTQKPEDVAFVWNAITEPDPEEDPNAWREYFEINACDEESIQTVAMIQDKGLSEYDMMQSITPLWELSWSFMWQISHGHKTAQVAINEVAQEAQAYIDDAFNVN